MRRLTPRVVAAAGSSRYATLRQFHTEDSRGSDAQ